MYNLQKGITMKTCRICKEDKPLAEYHSEPKNSDGHRNECKDCRRASDRLKSKNRSLKTKASNIFTGITQRCTNQKRQEERPKYKNVSNLLNRKEFIKWYIENYFNGCEVDRVNDDKDYSIDNIQLLSKIEHNQKSASKRIDLENKTAICTKCGVKYLYTKDDFYTKDTLVSAYNPLGIRSTCKKCNKQKGVTL